jgi:hypothetical protein
MKMYNNVKILETDLEREYITKHGLLWNSSGKEHVALKLSAVVKKFFQQEESVSRLLAVEGRPYNLPSR